MIHYISPKYKYESYDFSQYFECLNNYCRSREMPFFISDWNSDKSIYSPIELARMAFETSIANIDNYYSSGNNYCQDIIAEILRKVTNQDYQSQQITIGNNATSLISFCIQNLLSIGILNYLAIAPIYFSAVDAVQIGRGSITIIQPKLPDLSIDLNQFEITIRKLGIQAVIITDPYFGFGKAICTNQFKQIVQICRAYKCTVICDFARYGLNWKDENDLIVFNEKISIFHDSDRFALVFSPCKQLFANGIKSAIMVTSRNYNKFIMDYSDSVLGSVSAAQLAFLSAILDSKNQSKIISDIKKNLTHIHSNYEKIQSCTLGTEIISYQPNMGNYMVLGIPKIADDYHTFQHILNRCNISTLPLSLYHFFDCSRYFFRVNLSLESMRLLSSILAIDNLTGCTQ